MKILRDIKFEQPDHHWQNQLKHEKDICAQLDCVEVLSKYPSPSTRACLSSVIENNEIFYKVRIQSAFALAEVANKMVHTWNGPLPLISTFKKLFMSPVCHSIVSCNSFTDLQMYFIQKNLPLAIAKLRNSHNLCPSECIRFLLDLIKYNENSKNNFSDCFYKASLIEALGCTIAPASVAASLQLDSLGPKSANLTQDIKLVLEEIVLRLNLEKVLPTYAHTITSSCLIALRNFQKLGHIPEDIEIFKDYVSYSQNFENVRIVAFDIIIEFLSGNFLSLTHYSIDNFKIQFC
jgi:transcription initiation factor TFIID subunit 2